MPGEALTVVLEPPLPDQAPVAYYAHAGQLQLPFAELHQLAKVFAPVMDEWLSAGEVDLFHTWDRQRAWLFLLFFHFTNIHYYFNGKSSIFSM